jgi:hypothetical protein
LDAGCPGLPKVKMRRLPSLSRVRTRCMLTACCGLLVGMSARSAEVPPRQLVLEAHGIVEAFAATCARENRMVESFTTSKTYTIVHDGQTRAEVVAALRYTAPDVKTFAVVESRGSDFLRDRVIRKMMESEVAYAQRGKSSEVAFNESNYEFVGVRDAGDAFVIETVPRRDDELLFKGRIWITKAGAHLQRIDGEPARTPSFWTRRIHFVSDFAPVNGVWLHVRTVAHVTMRWFGDYVVQSECGPYQMVLATEQAGGRH